MTNWKGTKMSKESIVRKIAALKAKIGDKASTANEVESAIRLVDKLMQEYNINETDIGIKQAGVEAKAMPNKGKNKPNIRYCVVAIGKLSETYPFWDVNTKAFTFVGTKVDVDYAQWLYRLIENALEQSWKAFRFSYDYTKMVKRGTVHGRIVRDQFEKAFILTVSDNINALVATKPIVTGNALVLVKNELIKSFLDNQFTKKKDGKSITLAVNEDAKAAIIAGYNAGNEVRLRQEADYKETLLLEGN